MKRNKHEVGMMRRRVLISLTIAAAFCLCLFKSRGLATSSSSQQISLVVISWQVHLDDTTNFDFTRLAVSLQRRPGKPHAWTMVGSFTPDKYGRFVTSVPAGSWVSMDVTTSDPTVKRSTDSPNDVDFFEVEQNKTATVMQQEFYVPTDSPEHIERALDFHRGAAFSVCVPEGLKSGSIQFYKESKAHEDKVSVISFIDKKSVYGSLIGGLEDGKWRVMYIGDNDVIFRSDEIDLRRGQIFRQECGKAIPKGEFTTTTAGFTCDLDHRFFMEITAEPSTTKNTNPNSNARVTTVGAMRLGRRKRHELGG